MKIALCLLVFLTGQTALLATDTAYTALRAYGKQSGSASLGHVVELRGKAGAPEPEIWKITMEDPAARGGLRELELRHGKIVSERAPTARPTSAPMDLNHLNLDSDGVFSIANQEAVKLSISFDHVDYTLRTGSRGGAPVWQVELFDGRNGRVASFDIAADSGTVLHKDLTRERVSGPDVSGDHAYVDPPPREHREVVVEDSTDQDDDQPGGFGHFVDHVKHHFEKRGRQFENFFSGRGWTDR